jgi:hypothetical protein
VAAEKDARVKPAQDEGGERGERGGRQAYPSIFSMNTLFGSSVG